MSFLRRRWRLLVALALLAAGAAVLVLLPRGEIQSAVKVGDGMTITWHDDTQQVEISAIGYRKKAVATVRIGSLEPQQVRADGNGTVHTSVFLGPAPGRAGTSVLVKGQGAGVGSRTLIGGLPPAAVGRGFPDVVPWAAAAALDLAAVLTVVLRRRGRHRRRWILTRRFRPPASTAPAV